MPFQSWLVPITWLPGYVVEYFWSPDTERLYCWAFVGRGNCGRTFELFQLVPRFRRITTTELIRSVPGTAHWLSDGRQAVFLGEDYSVQMFPRFRTPPSFPTPTEFFVVDMEAGRITFSQRLPIGPQKSYLDLEEEILVTGEGMMLDGRGRGERVFFTDLRTGGKRCVFPR